MASLAIAGGGVVGLLTAFAALRQGRQVTLIDPESRSNISWNGSRIVRDADSSTVQKDTRIWRAVLDIIDYGPVAPYQVRHLHGKKWVVEKDAFVADTSRVRHKLLQKLQSLDGFERLTHTLVARVVSDGRAVLLDDGQTRFADRVVVAAGKGGRMLCPKQDHAVSLSHQAFAQFDSDDDIHLDHAFIQHDATRGLWGMPQIGDQPAKISASDLCFDTTEGAVRFMASSDAKAAFLKRVSALYPHIDTSRIIWECQSYASAPAATPFRMGAAVLHLACNGGDFKRAPRIATRLLR